MFTKVFPIIALATLVACTSQSTATSPVDGSSGGLSVSQMEDEVDSATEAALTWLALVDTGKYGDSWRDGAKLFRAAIVKARWVNAVGKVRRPLGQVSTRVRLSGDYKTSLPHAPNGRYVLIRFDTSFAHKPGAVETLTTVQEQDGDWRVAGYFVK